jgi:hypothetical protein
MQTFDAGFIETNGVTIPIQVTDRGDWRAEYDGRIQSYPTREKLEARLKTLTRQSAVKVEIPVVRVTRSHDGATRVRATLTGIHGANGNVLGTLHYGGRRGDIKEQFARTYGSSGELWFGGDVTDEQIAEYAELRRVKYEAEKAVQAAEARYEIKDIKAVVQRAVDTVRGTDED